MLRDEILKRFQECEPVVLRIIQDVIDLEWERLSSKKPQLKNEVRQIIDDAIKEAKQL